MEACTYVFQKRSFCFIAAYLFAVISALGQEQRVVRDLGLWSELKLNKEVINDFELSLGQHLRFNKNISSFDDYIFDLELEYSINKSFAVGAVGRYERNRHYDETVENDYRYDLFFKFDTKINEKAKFYYRLKYQKKFYDSAVFNEFLNYYESTYRNRIKLGYQGFKNHQQYISAEIFRLIKKSRDPYFSKYRIFAGNTLPVDKHNLDVALGYEHDLNHRYPLDFFIIKIQWQFEL